MEKMKMESPDLTARNIELIAGLFPDCITEVPDEERSEPDNTVYKKAVNFDMLRQKLSGGCAEGSEAFGFTWVGKKAAVAEAYKPVRKTLRPYPEESSDWDTTGNIYIEGDNLDALKLLQESYLHSVKVIFIDPPYNTGSDRFVYPDNYRMNADEYDVKAGMVGEEGVTLFRDNSKTNPRFHSLWCSMMYSRLLLARNLLSDDGGIIFITLDDGEIAHARMMCDEIFGEDNFISEFIWEKKKKPSFLHRNIGKLFDYVLCYSSNSASTNPFSVDKTTKGKSYPVNNAGNPRSTIVFPPYTVRFSMESAVFEPQDMSKDNIYTVLKNRVEVEEYYNTTEIVLDGEWRYSQEKIDEILANGETFHISKAPFRPNHIKGSVDIKKMKNVLSPATYGCETNEDATGQIMKLFGFSAFDTPKPVGLIELLLEATTYGDKDALVMDFFSGSATTAHAVLSLNAKDGGNRKFIMVQYPEPYKEKDEAYARGFRTISDAGKERIRLAAKKIREEAGTDADGMDLGFRVFKVDESNMNDVYFAAGEYRQEMLSMMESNIKAGRTDLDLLFGCLLEWGLPLSRPYTSEKIGGFTVHTYDGGELIACFDENIPETVITEIASRRPRRAVFRDSCFSGCPEKINAGELFKSMAPDTVVKVI